MGKVEMVERIDTTTKEGLARLVEICDGEERQSLVVLARAIDVNQRALDAWAGRPRDDLDWRARMSELCATFPILDEIPGCSPWDPDLLDANARGRASSIKAVISFVLHVWNGSHKWKVGRFNAIEAIASWDLNQRAAFEAWVRYPWWP